METATPCADQKTDEQRQQANPIRIGDSTYALYSKMPDQDNWRLLGRNLTLQARLDIASAEKSRGKQVAYLDESHTDAIIYVIQDANCATVTVEDWNPQTNAIIRETTATQKDSP
jgi:hypothetical protein